MTGTGSIYAWGELADVCTFQVGVAVEDDVPASGSLDLATGVLTITIEGSETVHGPFSRNFQFEPDVLPIPASRLGSRLDRVHGRDRGAFVVIGFAVWLGSGTHPPPRRADRLTRKRGVSIGADGGNRTHNRRFTKPLLYR